jgi:hypothetical protein
MTTKTLIALIGLFATFCGAFAQPRIDEDLAVVAFRALRTNVSTNEIVQALGKGLWNTNKTAVAIAIAKPKASLIYVFLRQTSGKYLAVDVSDLEGANFGHLGIAGRAGYDRFETIPIQWLHRDDGLFEIMMRTRAWKGRQRYSTSGALVIKPDGTLLWQ